MRISLVVIAVAFLVAATLADDQATSLQEARTAVEANLKTREGKTYDEKLGKEFMDKHLSTMKQCAQRAGNDLESFWILMKLDKDGAVKEVLLHPATKLGACAKETLLKATFSPPPRAAYWLSVYMKLTHAACRTHAPTATAKGLAASFLPNPTESCCRHSPAFG